MATAEARLRRIGAEILLLDGGLGTLLIADGLDGGRPAETWTLEHPERLVAIHRRYVDAGSDLIHANTFGSSPPKLALVGLAGRCAEVNIRAVELARQAAGPDVLVAADIGPTGLLLPPVGNATEAGMEAAFVAQAEALAQTDCDLLAIETMFDVREALAALRAAAAVGLPAYASMTFEKRRRGAFTIMGDRVGASMQALAAAGAIAVGCNCSVTSDVMVEMVREAAEATDLPIVAQPNAGAPRPTPDGAVVYDADDVAMAEDVCRMVAAGARLVGGCCGSGPGFVRAARRALGAAGLA